MSESDNSSLVPVGSSKAARAAIPSIIICVVMVSIPVALVLLGIACAIGHSPVAAGLLFSCATIYSWFVVPYFIHMVVATYEKFEPENLRGRILLQQSLLPLYSIFRNNRFHAICLSNLGTWELSLANFDRAEHFFRRALKVQDRGGATKSLDSVFVITANLANALSRLHRYDEASTLLEPCVQAVLNTPDRFSPSVCWFVVFSMLYLKTHSEPINLLEAQTYFQMTEEFYSRVAQSTDISRQFEYKYAMLSAAAVYYFKQGEPAHGTSACLEFLNLARYRAAAVPLSEIERFNEVGELLFNCGEFDLCEQFLDIAYRSGANEPFHPMAQRTLINFEKLLVATDRSDEVADMKRWLRLVVALPPQK
ncbi:MAG TPA: tetratricopeptide repeat protein [Drouetiella sp.]